MSKAGNREKQFIDFCNSIDKKILSGKMSFKDSDKVYVSVDNSIVLSDKVILIEIDASNQAKLVTGQYVLLNLLKDQPSKKYKKVLKGKELTFFVIHCYGNSVKGNRYNSDRSKNNFRSVAKLFSKTKAIKFGSIHIEEIINNKVNTKSKLIKLIESSIA